MSDAPEEFPFGDVIGAMTGFLLGEIGGVYRVCAFMAKEPVWTHQLVRVGREIQPVILRQHPHLSVVVDEVKAVTPENWRELLAGWQERFGSSIALNPMTDDDHERIDPFSEMAEFASPDRIIVVKA